jgi:hypothetical protein
VIDGINAPDHAAGLSSSLDSLAADPLNAELSVGFLVATVDGLEQAPARARRILLRLLFPNHFERIVSGGHERRIVEPYAEQRGVDSAVANRDDYFPATREVS